MRSVCHNAMEFLALVHKRSPSPKYIRPMAQDDASKIAEIPDQA